MADEVQNTNAGSNGEAAKYRRRAREYKTQLEALQTQFNELKTNHDSIAAELAAAPEKYASELNALRGSIRTRNHKDAFAKIATEKKIRPEAVEDAFALSGWSVEVDEVDETKMGETLDSLIEAKPYLKVAEVTTPPVEESSTTSVEANRNSLSSGLPRPSPGFGKGPAPGKSTNKNAKQPGRLA